MDSNNGGEGTARANGNGGDEDAAVVQVATVAVDSRRHTRHSELRAEQASKSLAAMARDSERKADRAGELLAATARDSEQKADQAGEAPAAMVRDSQLKAERVGELPVMARHSALQAK